MAPMKTTQQVSRNIWSSLRKPEFVAPSVLQEDVLRVQEVVLRVPIELAKQAMELAIKSGKKNIRVEIISK